MCTQVTCSVILSFIAFSFIWIHSSFATPAENLNKIISFKGYLPDLEVFFFDELGEENQKMPVLLDPLNKKIIMKSDLCSPISQKLNISTCLDNEIKFIGLKLKPMPEFKQLKKYSWGCTAKAIDKDEMSDLELPKTTRDYHCTIYKNKQEKETFKIRSTTPIQFTWSYESASSVSYLLTAHQFSQNTTYRSDAFVSYPKYDSQLVDNISSYFAKYYPIEANDLGKRLNKKGFIFFKKKKYKEAIKRFYFASLLAPKNVYFKMNLASSCGKLSADECTLNALQAAYKINPILTKKKYRTYKTLRKYDQRTQFSKFQ